MKKFQPEGPFVAARDGLLNGKVYAEGEPVDLAGLGPRRRRVLYDAGRIMYPPQDKMLAEAAPVEEPGEVEEPAEEGDDDLGAEFEELFAEDDGGALPVDVEPEAEGRPRRPAKKKAPTKKK